MTRLSFDALILDFDGVLIESEYAGNKQIADYLSTIGHPISVEEAMHHFMGLGGRAFTAAIEQRIGRPLPDDFEAVREAEDARVLVDGLEEVAGAIAFVRALPHDLPCAIASSSSVEWIERHLEHLGLGDAFGDKIFSGREHVSRGKPAPDLYLHAAAALGADIGRTVVIEDSPVGVKGAVAAGAQVIGLCAGQHCFPGHDERLRALGAHHVVAGFDDIYPLLFGAGANPKGDGRRGGA